MDIDVVIDVGLSAIVDGMVMYEMVCGVVVMG